jgi:hypothetical protein
VVGREANVLIETITFSEVSTNTGPSIVTQPQSQNHVQGDSAAFAVSASGTGPLKYQWAFNGSPIAGATASSGVYNIASVQTSNAGSYTVTITNTWGAVTSSAAVLTVLVPPTISTQPMSQTNNQGASAVFAVTASGTAPLSYQWRHAGTNVATGSRLILAPLTAASAGTYLVVVTNVGGSITSSPAVLTVILWPTNAVLSASSATVSNGYPFSISVTASGTTPFAYQWKQNGAALSGATMSAYTNTAAAVGDSGTYTVVLTNAAGAASSGPCVVTVLASPQGPAITNQTGNQTIYLTQVATHQVWATGSAPLSYQWRLNGSPLLGASLSAYNTSVAGTYSCVVTNFSGSAISSNAVLTVSPMPALPIQLKIVGP